MTKRMLYGLLFVALILLLGGLIGASLAQDQVTPSPDEPADATRSNPEGVASPEAVTVEKVANDTVVDPDVQKWVDYVVTFSNDAATLATLDRITDTLPSGFKFIGPGNQMDPQVGDPVSTDNSQVVWQGPFSVPASGTLKLHYWIEVASDPGVHMNSVEASSGGAIIGPDTAEVTVVGETLSLSKSATPSQVATGGLVTYDVAISNGGTITGAVSVISDTLPAGFQFEGVHPDSDIGQAPSGTTGTIVWTGPFTVPQSGDLHLIYRVRTAGVGSWNNSVVVRDEYGHLVGPEGSSVTTTKFKVYLPLLIRNYPEYVPPQEYLNEEFTQGVPDEWTVFLNWPELATKHWYWKGDGTTWGRLGFDAGEALDQWALDMYLGEGAQEWTDYKIEATIRSEKQYRHPLTCIWFRGTHQLRTDNQGGDVTGYIFCMRPDKDLLYLGYVDPNERKLTFAGTQWVSAKYFVQDLQEWYDVTIEVQDNSFTVYIGGNKQFQWWDLENRWTQGTVGFAVYRGAAGFDSIRVSPLTE